MQYHWGLGIGHVHAHGQTTAATPSSSHILPSDQMEDNFEPSRNDVAILPPAEEAFPSDGQEDREMVPEDLSDGDRDDSEESEEGSDDDEMALDVASEMYGWVDDD